jgi:hypothetical protein
MSKFFSSEQKYVTGYLLFELCYFYFCKSYTKNPLGFFLHPGETVVVRAQERGPTFKGEMHFRKKNKIVDAQIFNF